MLESDDGYFGMLMEGRISFRFIRYLGKEKELECFFRCRLRGRCKCVLVVLRCSYFFFEALCPF